MAVLRRSISKPRAPEHYTPELAASDAVRLSTGSKSPSGFVDPYVVAASLGIPVLKLPLPADVSGFLRNRHDGWQIGVNALHHPNRQRFTIAHEIGHYLMHRNYGDFEDKFLFRRDQNYNADERDANKFAAMLLMDERQVRNLFTGVDSVKKISETFEVSLDAAKFRLAELGLLTIAT